MTENLNIFGQNQGEIGSLNKNLVLRTQGQVYIRFGQKYIELLDRNGNLNVKIPKIFNKVNSEEEMTSDGFYILDGNLYFYFNNAIQQLTGLDEEEFISYSENQDLNSTQIDTAQQNIGLKFKSLEEAQKTIKSGHVFIEDSIYYIGDSQATKLGSLNEPLNSINALDDLPNRGLNNVAILCDKGTWKFIPVVTYTEFQDYITSQQKSKEESSKEEEKVEETSSIFDPIQYSTVYNVKSANFIIDQNGIISGLQVEETPPFDLTEGDILICSIKGSYATIGQKTNNLGETKNIIVPESSIVQKEMIIEISEYLQNGTLDSLKNTLQKEFPGCTYIQNGNYLIVTYPKEQIKYRIFTFDFIYKNNKLYFIDKEGDEITFSTTKIEDQTLYSSLNGRDFILEQDFNNSHFYVKLESEKKEKFKINYENAEIALEENLRKNGEIKIIPHTVLGDLDDKIKYYNSPSKSFRTYNEKEGSQGLYSDQPVFNGTEFRGKFPEEKDFEISDFPRYSKKLNKELFENLLINYSAFEEIIPSIKFVEQYFAKAEYNKTDKKIYFYNQQNIKLAEIDATDFIKDGMVSNVEVINNNIIITFNTDSGKEDISIPISKIFDASEYYTKSETYSKSEIDAKIGGNKVIMITSSTTVSSLSSQNTYYVYNGSGNSKLTISSELGTPGDIIIVLKHNLSGALDISYNDWRFGQREFGANHDEVYTFLCITKGKWFRSQSSAN